MVAEVLRGGAFTDDVVINLVNRRFVANFYDVAPPGENFGDAWAYDKEAIKAIGEVRGKGGGGTQDPSGRVKADAYPAAIFVTPEGKRLDADLYGIVGPAKFVEHLRGVMKKYPEWFVPTKEEAEIEKRADENPRDPQAQLEDARLAWELADWNRCLKRTATTQSLEGSPKIAAELAYLEARVCTCQGEAEKALASLGKAEKLIQESDPMADDVLVARARVRVNQGRYGEALAIYETVIGAYPKGDRVGEALYYSGLCLHYSGKKEEAKKLWRRHREELPGDRLARRSAISLGLEEAEAFLNQEIVDRKGWW